jgi:hypothetical protein
MAFSKSFLLDEARQIAFIGCTSSCLVLANTACVDSANVVLKNGSQISLTIIRCKATPILRGALHSGAFHIVNSESQARSKQPRRFHEGNSV